MAVWSFNKPRVYIKTHMPFSAEFHGCLDELAELERITIQPRTPRANGRRITIINKGFWTSAPPPPFSLCSIKAIKVLHVREGSTTGSFTRRMTGMQHVFQMWVCAPQADPQCKLPNLCLLVQLRVMRTGADSWAQAPFSPVWSRRKAFVLSWKQTESKFRRPNNNFLNSINRSLLGVVKCSIWSCRPFERQGRFSPFQSVPEEPEGRVCQNTVYAVVWLQLENALCSRKNRRRADLELLLELTVEACQHRVAFLVLADRHLDLPLLSRQQPERILSSFKLFTGNIMGSKRLRPVVSTG